MNIDFRIGSLLILARVRFVARTEAGVGMKKSCEGSVRHASL